MESLMSRGENVYKTRPPSRPASVIDIQELALLCLSCVEEFHVPGNSMRFLERLDTDTLNEGSIGLEGSLRLLVCNDMGDIIRQCRWAKVFLKGATLVMDEVAEVEEGGCGEDAEEIALGLVDKAGWKDHNAILDNSGRQTLGCVVLSL